MFLVLAARLVGRLAQAFRIGQSFKFSQSNAGFIQQGRQFLRAGAELARGIVDLGQSCLGLIEQVRIEFDPVGIVAQFTGSFLGLDQAAVQHLQRRLQGRIDADHVQQSIAGGLQLADGALTLLFKHGNGLLGRLDQFGGVGQAAVVILQGEPVVGPEIQRDEFVHLPLQAFTFSGGFGRVTFRFDAGLVQFLPGAKGLAGLRGERFAATVGVQHLALHAGPEQGVMGVLAVNVDQEFAGFLELTLGRRPAIDEGAGTSAGVDHPAQQETVLL